MTDGHARGIEAACAWLDERSMPATRIVLFVHALADGGARIRSVPIHDTATLYEVLGVDRARRVLEHAVRGVVAYVVADDSDEGLISVLRWHAVGSRGSA